MGDRLAVVGAALGRLRPTQPAHYALVVLLLAGATMRVVGALSFWPVTTTLADSIPYASYAEGDPLDDPQHPAGYSLILAAIGVVSREVTIPVVLQHLSAFASALLLYGAVVRQTGSRWAALAPVAVIMLNADLIFLEHAIMAESTFLLALAAGIYALVRVIELPDPWWRWPLACGAMLAACAMIRSAGLFFVPIAVLAVVLSRPRPWRANWRGPSTIAAAATLALLAYATASNVANGRFEVAPAQGWHLYARVAPFAECSRFTAPAGTEGLCERRPPAQRPGLDYYLYDPGSPAHREFETIGAEDERLRAFAQAAILAQPGAFAEQVWEDVKGYYVPSKYPFRTGAGSDLDPQLDWAWTLGVGTEDVPITEAEIEAGMEDFFDPFSVDVDAGGVNRLRDVQTLLRYGAAALAITTLLIVLGLLIGSRRNRIGVLLLGGGGLAVLLVPMLSVYYVARYSVPVAPLLAAGAAIAVLSLWRLEAERRSEAAA